MSNVIKIDMNSYTVKQDVAAIPEALLNGAEEGALQVAYLMKAFAIWKVRVDWGNLRDTIRVERGGKGMHWRQVRVRAGGYLLKRGPKAGQPVTYAAIIEAKYPFMKPAWDEVQPEALPLITRICMAEIARLESVQP